MPLRYAIQIVATSIFYEHHQNPNDMAKKAQKKSPLGRRQRRPKAKRLDQDKAFQETFATALSLLRKADAALSFASCRLSEVDESLRSLRSQGYGGPSLRRPRRKTPARRKPVASHLPKLPHGHSQPADNSQASGTTGASGRLERPYQSDQSQPHEME